MKKTGKNWLAVCLIGGLFIMQITGCGQKENTSPNTSEALHSTQNGDSGVGNGETLSENNHIQEGLSRNPQAVGRSEERAAAGQIRVTASLGEGAEKTILYELEDLEEDWEEDKAVPIKFTGEGIEAENMGVTVSDRTATIVKGGTYLLSGELTEGQIRIQAKEGEIVRMILQNVDLTNTHTAPIYSSEKCKVILTLAAGSQNRIQDGSDYQFDTEGEDEPDAPIFVKGNLTINGTGTLEVSGNYQSGIRSKDNLKIMSGTISVTAMDDGLKGKDSVIIRDGVITIQSVKDGIKSNQDQDPEKGFIWIDGGEITIAAKDDGIQAETALIVCGGRIDITESQEGLAGKTVDILGGLIKAITEDDGINSAASVETEREKMQDQEGVYTRIAGGEVWLNARADGIDSNGDLYLEGGTLYLSGPVSRGDGILDYNGKATITGGTLLAAGNSGMMQTFGEESTQNYLVVYWEETQPAGSQLQLTDEEGTLLGTYAPEKDYNTAILSTPGMETGKTYYVKTESAEESEIEITITGLENIYGTPAPGMGGPSRGFGRPGRGEPGAGRPEGFDKGEEGTGRPEGFEGGEPGSDRPEDFDRGKPGSGHSEGFGRGEGDSSRPEGFDRGKERAGRQEDLERGEPGAGHPEDLSGSNPRGIRQESIDKGEPSQSSSEKQEQE